MELLKSLGHPEETYALIKFSMKSKILQKPIFTESSDLKTCFELLDLTSRSFSMVIKNLDEPLRNDVCLFYLILRALDTVEDDLSLDNNFKDDFLRNFYSYLSETKWKLGRISNDKDGIVLEKFQVVLNEYHKLNESSQNVISEITQKMGIGMADTLKSNEPKDFQEWNLYCHYVAGLVGIGLTKLFQISGLEDDIDINNENILDLANSMGLFLQKTNIIRDYFEDVRDGRLFWPKSVYKRYVKQQSDIRYLRNDQQLEILDDLICDALQHVGDVFQYLSLLKNPTIFRFCAIPQIMAIATLERCFNNADLFNSVIKIRRGETVSLLLNANNLCDIENIFQRFLLRMKRRSSKRNIDQINRQLMEHKDSSVAVANCLLASSISLLIIGFGIRNISDVIRSSA